MSAYQDVEVVAVEGSTVTLQLREIHPDAPAIHVLFVDPDRSLVEDRVGRETFAAWLLVGVLDSVIATSSLVEGGDWARDIIRDVVALKYAQSDHSDTHSVPMYEATLQVTVKETAWLEGLNAGGGFSSCASPYQQWAPSQVLTPVPPSPEPLVATPAELARCARMTLELLRTEGFLRGEGENEEFVEPEELVVRAFDPRDPDRPGQEFLRVLAAPGGQTNIVYARRNASGANLICLRDRSVGVACSERLKGFRDSKSKTVPVAGVRRRKTVSDRSEAFRVLRGLAAL